MGSIRIYSGYSSEEKKVMDKSLRRLQLVELDLLKQIDFICKENGIPYFAMGGTLLGAIRHKGFIPWDDDIDIGIPRPYYNKLGKILNSEKYKYLRYRSFHNDSTYYRYFARVESTKIKVVRHDKNIAEESNAWIDIFPLDAMPNHYIVRQLFKLRVLMLRAEYRLSDYDHLIDTTKKNRPLHQRMILFAGKNKKLQKLFDTRKCLHKMEKVLTFCNYEKSSYIVNAMGAWSFKEMFNKKYYGEGVEYDFEDMKIPGPVDYDFVLRQLYGEYMVPPSRLEDSDHHKIEILD